MQRQCVLVCSSECVCVLCSLPTDAVSNKLQGSNVFTVARRTADAQELLYLSVKLTNGLWLLAELRVQSANPNHAVRRGEIGGGGATKGQMGTEKEGNKERKRRMGKERQRHAERKIDRQRE